MPRRPLIAIVGRPNVGKSTLFNRLVGERKAVVHPMPGMTRDRHYADTEYRGRPFTVIDTGGYEDEASGTLLGQMRMQSLVAIQEADVVIFLTDVHEPDDPVDLEILERLRASGKPFYLAVNKCEGRNSTAQAWADFARFGVAELHPISGREGDGVYDMLDILTENFASWDPDKEDAEKDGLTRIAIVGRQNVGKSTLLNRLFGSERVIANPLGGTTRDAIDVPITVDGKQYLVIDTAGIRRRGSIEEGPEKLSVHSSFRAIDRATVCLLVIDAAEGVTQQDQHIAGYILERRKSCIILLNKWDAVEDRQNAYGRMINDVRMEFRFMPWAPIISISALTGQRTHRIWGLIEQCAKAFTSEFSTSDLNMVLRKATTYLSPPAHKGNAASVKYVTQIRTSPPTLALFVNDPKFIHFSYRRFLKNQFYEQLGLEGTPLFIRFRRKAPPRGWDPNVRVAAKSETRKDAKPYFARAYNEDGSEFVQEFDLSKWEEDVMEEQWEEDDEE